MKPRSPRVAASLFFRQPAGIPARQHDVECSEYARRNKHHRLEAPEHNRIGRCVTVPDSKQAQRKYNRDVPRPKTAVGRNGHAARAEHKNHQPRNQPQGIALARYELSRKRKGEEAQIGFKEVAYPYSESEHDVKPRALHVKQDAETVPHSHDALLHADYKTRIAEHIAHDSHHDYGKDDKNPQRAVGRKAVKRLAHGVSIKKLVDIAPRHYQGQDYQHQYHHRIRCPVAEVGAYNRRQLAILAPGYVDTTPRLAKIRKHQIKRIGPEYRHTLGHGRDAGYSGCTKLNAPAHTPYDVRQNGNHHHGRDVTVIDTLLYDRLHLVYVDLVKKPHDKPRRNRERHNHLQHTTQNIPTAMSRRRRCNIFIHNFSTIQTPLLINRRPIFHSNMKKQCMNVQVNDSSTSMHWISMYSCSYFLSESVQGHVGNPYPERTESDEQNHTQCQR